MSELSYSASIAVAKPTLADGDSQSVGRVSRRVMAIALAMPIALLAVGLRAWGIGATFESSDQVMMPYFIQHYFGIKWLLAHNQGVVPAVLLRGSAELLWRLNVPLSEAAYRLPVMLISLAQLGLTYALLRRLRRSSFEALLGVLCCALIPTLVVDAHYAWGYLSIWLFFGTLALWGTLAWIDDQRGWQLFVAGSALLAHCLSNCFSYGLPLTLLVVWMWYWLKRGKNTTKSPRWPFIRSAMLGLVLPASVALAVIFFSWQWTGAGQIGRIVAKHNLGTSGLQYDQLMRLPAMWCTQYGYLFGAIAGLGVLFGLRSALKMRREGLLAVWCVAELLPLVLLADWDRIGYAVAYMIEAAYVGGLLGVIFIGHVYRKLVGHQWMRRSLVVASAAAFIHMGVGAADESLAHGQLAKLTGIDVKWGSVRKDTGIKAAGWYVRNHVPINAMVMPLHTNKGMEVCVAEFYLGRKVLACCDLIEPVLWPLVQAMHDDVDVLIVEEPHHNLAEDIPGFELVCALRNGDQLVRRIYARPELSLPKLDEQLSVLNKQYDRQYTPRHIPLALPSAPDFTLHLSAYQAVVKQLRAQH